MLKLSIHVDACGSAFDAPAAELARILREAAEFVETIGPELAGVRSYDSKIRDVNGNHCGHLVIEDE